MKRTNDKAASVSKEKGVRQKMLRDEREMLGSKTVLLIEMTFSTQSIINPWEQSKAMMSKVAGSELTNSISGFCAM